MGRGTASYTARTRGRGEREGLREEGGCNKSAERADSIQSGLNHAVTHS